MALHVRPRGSGEGPPEDQPPSGAGLGGPSCEQPGGPKLGSNLSSGLLHDEVLASPSGLHPQVSKKSDPPRSSRPPVITPPPRQEESLPLRPVEQPLSRPLTEEDGGGLRLTDQDFYLFNEGSHFQLYDKLGAHPVYRGGDLVGVSFAVMCSLGLFCSRPI